MNSYNIERRDGVWTLYRTGFVNQVFVYPPQLSQKLQLEDYGTGTGGNKTFYLPRPHKFWKLKEKMLSGSYRNVGYWDYRFQDDIYIGTTNSYAFESALYNSRFTDLYPLCYNDALEDAYSQAKGQKDAKINVALTVAEAPETIRMFTQALKAVGGLLIGFGKMKKDFAKFLRGDRSTPFSNNRRLRHQQRRFLEKRKNLSVRDWAQVPASLWLLKQYGITPLLSDIEGYRSYLQGKMVPPSGEDPSIFRVEGRKGRKQKGRFVLSADQAFCEGTKSDRALVSFSFKIRDADKAELTKLSTFSPFTVIYEKIPLSFVLDWVFNVGQYLELLEASLGAGLQFSHGFVTKSFSIQFTTTWSSVTNVTSGSFWQIGTTYYTGWSMWNLKDRVVLTDFPKPQLPSVSVSLGSHRLLSAAALLKTLFIK